VIHCQSGPPAWPSGGRIDQRIVWALNPHSRVRLPGPPPFFFQINARVPPMLENINSARQAKRYYRKKLNLLTLLEKMKLWPARSGLLHGLKTIERLGEGAILTTHCGRRIKVRDSRRGRAARWLRGKFYQAPCPLCAVPQWKLDKYGATFFSRRHGSLLRDKQLNTGEGQ